jgi:hypothetical protein
MKFYNPNLDQATVILMTGKASTESVTFYQQHSVINWFLSSHM